MKNIFTLLLGVLFALPLFSQEPLKISFGNLRARDVGPAVMSGRVSTVDGINDQPEVLYVGAASGGVWKSISGGASFSPVFDEHTQSIGAIRIDQNHPDTVWVGTGEPWVRNSVSVGTGVYVTTNGGKTWSAKGLEDSERISQIVVDPNNSGTIYVAAQGHLWGPNEQRGVYKSTDFGTTWERVLYVDENTGAADLAIDPTNPNTLYACMWEHRRTASFFNSGGPGSGLYKSTDGGVTWKKLTNGLPAGNLGRLAIAVAPSSPQTLYCSVEAEKQADKGLYRSTDGGANWEQINTSFGTKVRPFYFSRIVVDPNDADKIFKCGLNLIISEDGGNTFRTVGSGVHSDIHAVWVNPQNSNHIVLGTDGGGYRSLDGGYLFEMFMNLPISQFYQISVDNDNPYNIYGGLQDNGSWYGPSRSPGGIENKDWNFSYGGDGFYSFRHPTDPEVVYSESQGGNLARYNTRDGQAKFIKPLEGPNDPDYRFNWNAPIHLSPNNPERMYFGAQFLFMTEDRGDSWKTISPDLTTNDPERQKQKQSGGLSIDNSTAENNTTIYTIAESPVDEKVVWVGTDDGLVQVTENAGGSWTNVTPNIPELPAGLWVTKVEPSNHDRNTIYVTIDGHKSGNKTPYVYRSKDLGKTWKSLVTPDIKGYALTITEDLEAANILFLGTEFGLFVSMDQGMSWKQFKNNLPNVAVRAMAIQEREGALVIGTHGRGIYIIDDLATLRQISAEVTQTELHFFNIGPTYLRLAQQGSWFGGAGEYIGENPDVSAQIAYYLKKRHAFGKMTINVYDADGNWIKEVPAGKSKGINYVNLPTRLPMPKAAPTNNRMALFGSVFPPTLPEGTYTVVVTKGKKEYKTTFDLKQDPDFPYPDEGRKLALETQMRLYNMTNQLGLIYANLASIEQQATEQAGGQKKKMAAALNALSERAKTFKGSLVSLEGDFYVDESSAIREDISELYLYMGQYPGGPTESQVRKTDILEGEMQKVDATYQEIIQEMNDLNEKLAKQEATLMEIQTLEEYLAN